jgi:hypothetical protein
MSKETLKERLKRQREEIKKRSEASNSSIYYIKEGTHRIRPLPVGDEEEWGFEVIHFYLGKDLKGIISPTSVGLPCPISEKLKELSESKEDSDLELAKLLSPRRRYLVPSIVYKDEQGKQIDEENSGKLVFLTGKMYSQMIEFFLDSDLGDFTDPEEGYDIKINRTGKGKTDTEYTLSAMRPSKIPSKWHKEIDLESMVKKSLLSYDEIEEKLAEFLVEKETVSEKTESKPSSYKSKRRPHKTEEDN